jgi:anionic cell wall polymer biosynthesis LytR-Cps2A-Psr (LCP) family protein
MKGIEAANELVGHVKVKSLIDVRMYDGKVFHVGDTIELQGKYLDRYIRTRTQEINANSMRMERQKQYMIEFANLAFVRARKDLSFPVDLFSALAPYMVTNLDIPDVTFLSTTFLSHGANFSFRGIKGTLDKLNGTTVLYPDETDLFEAVLEVFYKQVD